MSLVLVGKSLDRPPLAIDLEGIVPDRLATTHFEDVARLVVHADSRPCSLGDLFAITGDPHDGRIECRGDFSRVHRVGAGMRWGTIEVVGPVGRHAGEGMTGGTLRVGGDAGDWLAAELGGGEVVVAGTAGDNVAAALPGSARGMTGGVVVVTGGVGDLPGARMRRGVLAIGGGCGAGAAFEMLAGTVVVGGPIGAHPGLGMRRGSLVALGGEPAIPPTFRRGAIWTPGFLRVLFHTLSRSGFRPADEATTGPWRQWHGDALAGGRGEIICPV